MTNQRFVYILFLSSINHLSVKADSFLFLKLFGCWISHWIVYGCKRQAAANVSLEYQALLYTVINLKLIALFPAIYFFYFISHPSCPFPMLLIVSLSFFLVIDCTNGKIIKEFTWRSMSEKKIIKIAKLDISFLFLCQPFFRIFFVRFKLLLSFCSLYFSGCAVRIFNHSHKFAFRLDINKSI